MPARFVVEDPLSTCQLQLGYPCYTLIYHESSWDLESPVSRPRQQEREPAVVE
jgi:hypothetical protein